MNLSYPFVASERQALVALALVWALSVPVPAQSTPQALPWSIDAGPDLFLAPPETSVVLRGAILDSRAVQSPDRRVMWEQLSGPPAAILAPDTLNPRLIPSRPGQVRMRLEVTGPDRSVHDDVIVRAFGAGEGVALSGEARAWHKLALTFTHDQVLSEGSTPNPFLDLRLSVDFFHDSGEVVCVPGFFAADGDAAVSGATSGDRWRVNFVPALAGKWYYVASFRGGSQIAIDLAPEVGQPLSFDGTSGTFVVENANPRAPGFLAKGRLEYVGRHHLRFAETHEYFLKSGAGSPENFLAYYEFDNTFDQGGAPNELNLSGGFDGLHHYDAHLSDYVDLGVELWNGRGQRIFGALSYLASRGVNSIYTLTYNIDGGDGREIWPWFPATNKLRFDVSKLAQWERVVDHMTRAGIVWHVFTQETENDVVLDFGMLGVQRKLYHRELVARFAHALGLVWNLGEENNNLQSDRMAFADHLRALDPYDHPIALHNYPGDLAFIYGELLGNHLELATLLSDFSRVPDDVMQLVDASLAAGRPWIVDFSEQGPPDDGAVPDAVDFWHDELRRGGLWPTVLGQGGGCEWYFGYAHAHNDLDCEDFRSRENLWLLSARALDFLRGHVPFEEMRHADALALANGPSALAKAGEFYLVYLPFGGPASLDLEGHVGPFLVSWFDARNGGDLRSGALTQVSGPGVQALGSPPGAGDWIAFLRRATNLPPLIESFTITPDPFQAGQDFSVQVHARDPNGPSDELRVRLRLIDPNGQPTLVPLRRRGGSLYSLFIENAPLAVRGTWRAVVTVRDSGDLVVTSATTFVGQ